MPIRPVIMEAAVPARMVRAKTALARMGPVRMERVRAVPARVVSARRVVAKMVPVRAGHARTEPATSGTSAATAASPSII
jgi:hypothetical protein